LLSLLMIEFALSDVLVAVQVVETVIPTVLQSKARCELLRLLPTVASSWVSS